MSLAILHELLARIRDTEEPFEDFVVEHEFAGIGLKRLILNARRLFEKLPTQSLFEILNPGKHA